MSNEFDQNEFDEAYQMAIEMMVKQHGGDRSFIQDKLMQSAPSMGMVVQQVEAEYEGSKGMLIWDYGICNEINFKYDDDDPDHFVVLYTAKDQYDAEIAFNHYYSLYKPAGAPDRTFNILGGADTENYVL